LPGEQRCRLKITIKEKLKADELVVATIAGVRIDIINQVKYQNNLFPWR